MCLGAHLEFKWEGHCLSNPVHVGSGSLVGILCIYFSDFFSKLLDGLGESEASFFVFDFGHCVYLVLVNVFGLRSELRLHRERDFEEFRQLFVCGVGLYDTTFGRLEIDVF